MRQLAIAAFALAAALGCASPAPGSTAASAPSVARVPAARSDHATVPLELEGNRPYVDLVLQTPEGEPRTARFLIDTGGGAFLLVEPLAKELGVSLGEKSEEDGRVFAPVTSPLAASIGGLSLALRPERILVALGRSTLLNSNVPGHADGMLPGHVLAQYDVVLDYPATTFTIGKPGTVPPEGTPVPMPVHPDSGFPRTELEVEGEKRGMLLDTGASFSMVSEAVLKAWGAAHADWRRYPGAYGEAATLGGMTLETMFIPAATWQGFALTDVGVVSQREGAFERWISAMTAEPVVGALAGNVLKQFRVQLDYAHQTLLLRRRS